MVSSVTTVIYHSNHFSILIAIKASGICYIPPLFSHLETNPSFPTPPHPHGFSLKPHYVKWRSISASIIIIPSVCANKKNRSFQQKKSKINYQINLHKVPMGSLQQNIVPSISLLFPTEFTSQISIV